ncbi:MAG TPA: aminotransferase class I/II-fold pyridoxal phosphate-dependent enzyme [Candidatus Acidoferrum sp.]|nr:aminotransferase class I/II-fold pyridoxal phosphate-dependent enzyme [Candidatus Acidoferrum sp.]
MTFTPFHLEQWQSEHEHEVAFNLADSGVHPVAVKELLENAEVNERMHEVALHYPTVNGPPRLRELIANLYQTTPSNVLVTVGAAEANGVVLQTMLNPGDEVVAMEPSYRQLWGITRNLGCPLAVFHLDPNNKWRANLDELETVVTPRTKLIGVTNPNNPTGKILNESEINRVVKIAEKHGTWILADEVYRGTERLTDTETPTFFGRYDRVIAVNSLSKAYGLSGLRIGWIVGPRERVDTFWRRHEYATISAGVLDMFFAEIALAEPMRTRLLARTRRLIREGYTRLESWVKDHSPLLSVIPPESTALAFVRYHLNMPSTTVAEALRQRAGVLVAPGEYFGIEHHLRITHGLNAEYLREALNRIGSILEELAGRSRTAAKSQ